MAPELGVPELGVPELGVPELGVPELGVPLTGAGAAVPVSEAGGVAPAPIVAVPDGGALAGSDAAWEVATMLAVGGTSAFVAQSVSTAPKAMPTTDAVVKPMIRSQIYFAP